MLHEHVETNILCEVVAICHGLISLTHLVRVDFDFNFSFMSVIWMCDEEPRHRETFLHDVLGIFNWCFKQCFKVLITRIIMVTSFLPLVYGVTLPDANIEESVKKKDTISFHLVIVKEHWLSLLIFKIVSHECWLDHDQ